MLVQVCLIFI